MPKKSSYKATEKFIKALNEAADEKDIEPAYREILRVFYPNTENKEITSDYRMDGYFENLLMRLELEAKYDEDFTQRHKQCSVLVQALYYIKKFKNNDRSLPNAVLIGDKNECFVIAGGHLYKYLEEEIDWNTAPSDAPKKNPSLVLKLEKDDNITPFVFSINKKFNFEDVINTIDALVSDSPREKIQITEKNIARAYDDFLRTVIHINETTKSKYKANELVSIFIQSMIRPQDTYIHPSKPNTLVLPNKSEIQIDGPAFYAFFTQFDRTYAPKQLELFTAIADRLLEETVRRFQGSFWTPNIWVDKAHEMLTAEIGETWRQDYIVWDCSCGSMNLTRDYDFDNLYCSTLFQNELDIGIDYNKNANKFQYDFLNDDVETGLRLSKKIPNTLLDALSSNKPLVFFNNPPYAQAGDKMGATGGDKSNVAATLENKKMLHDGVGSASQQLYAQFLWRFMDIVDEFDLKQVYIGLFSPTLLLTGPQYAKFRNRFLNMFEFEKGILFNASDFADVKDTWGISFTIYKLSIKNGRDKNRFKYDVYTIRNDKVVKNHEKTVYNTDGSESASDWVKSKNHERIDFPCCTNAINIATGKTQAGSMFKDAIGYFMNDSNNVYANSKYVGLFTLPHSHGHGVCVFDETFYKCISLFSARALVASDWINQKDEYLIPNVKHQKYNEWLNDCLVYSLFSAKSSQSSLRGIQYNGETINIKNEWFYMSKEEMMNIANYFEYLELYADAKSDTDRYVYKQLQSKKLSKEAQLVLNEAKKLTNRLIQENYRHQAQYEHPEWHLRAWDAGWYQQKLVLKEYHIDTSDFDNAMNILINKMRPMVYDLGFLK